MTDEGIALEYEASMAWGGESLKICPLCNQQTHSSSCPTCKSKSGDPVTLTGDTAIDKTMSMIAQDEDIEDLEALLRGGFAPVPRENAT